MTTFGLPGEKANACCCLIDGLNDLTEAGEGLVLHFVEVLLLFCLDNSVPKLKKKQ
jgi:hypothetical protein